MPPDPWLLGMEGVQEAPALPGGTEALYRGGGDGLLHPCWAWSPACELAPSLPPPRAALCLMLLGLLASLSCQAKVAEGILVLKQPPSARALTIL